jgi:septal ring factor EnvC (AmiA/AmiB activator)
MSNEGKIHIGSIGGDLSGNVAGGDIIQNSNLNIGSTLTNVSQQVGALPQASPADKAELEQLLKQLEAELKKVPADQREEAETVAEFTQELVEEAGKEKPKKGKLQITGDGLKKAAQNLAAVAPLVGEIAGKIVLKVLQVAAG